MADQQKAMNGSYDMLVMSNEIISSVKRILRGVPLDVEHLALEAIRRVGPRSHYLMDEHTMKHFRNEFWVPELLDRSNWETWQSSGGKALQARVHERVLDLIEHYDPPEMPEKTVQELETIVSRADEVHRVEEARRT